MPSEELFERNVTTEKPYAVGDFERGASLFQVSLHRLAECQYNNKQRIYFFFKKHP